ncbi:MAG: tetratricopeptide repeat protein [Syntrophobacterales bacterium]|jgi:tetratricopeptide (TPR) repeat protein|nr:tetratricopeptide repeat protein [Syntrophobacterales bacterium]
MEKNRVLVSYHKTFVIILFVLLVSSCSLPRIIVLRDPLTPEEHINLGVAYERKGEYAAALEEYEAASKTMPVASFYMANIYFHKGEYGKAEKLYEKTIAHTQDPRACNNLAWLYYTTGKHMEKAAELARKAVSLSPGSDDFLDTLSRVTEKLNEAPTR